VSSYRLATTAVPDGHLGYPEYRGTPALAVLAAPFRPVALVADTQWEVVLDAYLDAAVDSPHTRRAYGRAIRRAFAAFGVRTCAELTGADLARWRADLVQTPTQGLATQAQQLYALRSFLTWGRTMGAHALSGDVLHDALRVPRGSVARPYQVLDEEEIARLLTVASTPRDRALAMVALGAGLRVAEIAALDVADVRADLEGGAALYVRHGKGGKDRTVPVQPEVFGAIRAYLAWERRHLDSPGALFWRHDRGHVPGRLTAVGIRYLLAGWVREAGIVGKQISPHSLRHSFAVRSLRAGANTVAVQALLGHANLATTARYLSHLELGELRRAIPRLTVPPVDGAVPQPLAWRRP